MAHMKRILFLTSLIAAMTSSVFAQSPAGNITGSVRDQQGAAVPGAEVTVRGSDATFYFTTELDGAFRFLNLEPGTYRMTATLSGFDPATRDVIVAIGKTVDAPIELRV